MRIFNLSAAAERALSSASSPARRETAYIPFFTVRTASGASLDAASATGAFRILRQLSPGDRENARIYDEDGLCLYR